MEEIEIPLGAHIYSPRLKGVYNHHGIYVGNYEVVHYSGFSKGFCSGPINKVSLEEFLDGNTEFCMREYTDPIYTREYIVERAISRIDEDDYCVFRRNCEHFATWVHTDIYGSLEAASLVEKAANLAIVVGGKVDKRVLLSGAALKSATKFYTKRRRTNYHINCEKRFRISYD